MPISNLPFMPPGFNLAPTIPLAKPNKVCTTNGKDNIKLSDDTILINTVTTDDYATFNEFKIEPTGRARTQITLSYDKNNLKSLNFKSFDGGNEKDKFSFPNTNSVCELKRFLTTIWDVDANALASGTLMLSSNSDNSIKLNLVNNIDLKNVEVTDLKLLIQKIIATGNISESDLELSSIRKKSLTKFEGMLKQDLHEADWQNFFQENQWIFGCGLDYRFSEIFKKEGASGDGKVDFVCTFKSYTSLVEIKRPTTKLFEKDRNRVDAWKLSEDLFDAYSQILAYKAGFCKKPIEHDKKGNKLYQRTQDPKIILIIGNIQNELLIIVGEYNQELAEDTFELFRRNNRNIEIITYDELFERAKFIVEGTY